MEKEKLSIFFTHTVDSEKATEKVNDFLDTFKNIGNARKTRIEIIPRSEFDQNISDEELLKKVDDTLREKDYNHDYNYYNLWVRDGNVVILGFSL